MHATKSDSEPRNSAFIIAVYNYDILGIMKKKGYELRPNSHCSSRLIIQWNFDLHNIIILTTLVGYIGNYGQSYRFFSREPIHYTSR